LLRRRCGTGGPCAYVLTSPRLASNLATACGSKGGTPRRRQSAGRRCGCGPGDPGAYFTLGLALYWGGKTPAAGARFYAEAFAAHPKLADDLSFPNRYNAACCAALAGCGQGHDAVKLDETERARLRHQALNWLRADLAAWGQLLEKEKDQARARAQDRLREWRQDADFAEVRGNALAKLPEAERQPWQQLWADVEQTLKRVNHQDTKDAKKKTPN